MYKSLVFCAIFAQAAFAQTYFCYKFKGESTAKYFTLYKKTAKTKYLVNMSDQLKTSAELEGSQGRFKKLKGQLLSLLDGVNDPEIQMSLSLDLIEGRGRGAVILDSQKEGRSLFACKTELSTTLEFDQSQLESPTRNYFYEMPPLCYRGFANEVPTLIWQHMAASDSLLHWDQGIQAIRFGEYQVNYYGDQFFVHWPNNPDFADFYQDYIDSLPEEVDNWMNYDTSSSDVLVLSDLGPQGDGTELYSTVIPACQ